MKRLPIAAAHLLLFLAAPTLVDAQCDGTSGRVVDHLTGEPIAGAKASGGFDSTAVTDAQGCFTLATVYTEACNAMRLDCAYEFAVSADGYTSYSEFGYRPPPNISRFFAAVRLAPLAAARCSGDCGDDHSVAIDELLCAVDALLTNAESGCTCADSDGDERLHIAEVVAAIRNALLGCVDCGPAGPNACGPLFPPD